MSVPMRRVGDGQSVIPDWLRPSLAPLVGWLGAAVIGWLAKKGINLTTEQLLTIVLPLGGGASKWLAAIWNKNDAAAPSMVKQTPAAPYEGEKKKEIPTVVPVVVVPTDTTTEVTAEHPAPAAPKKRTPKKKVDTTPPPPADTPEGEEHGAEQVDVADLPATHEEADYRPLGAKAMPDPGMGDERVGEYFVLGEFAVSASHPDLVVPVPDKLVPNIRRLASTCLDPIRRFCGKPVTVMSGYRGPRLNAAVGGSPTSQHVHGQAADIVVKGETMRVFEALVNGSLKIPAGQVIAYPSKGFLHVATPGWTYRSPTFQIHEPSLGLRYKVVRSAREFHELTKGKYGAVTQ